MQQNDKWAWEYMHEMLDWFLYLIYAVFLHVQKVMCSMHQISQSVIKYIHVQACRRRINNYQENMDDCLNSTDRLVGIYP